tara:strand:+ start:325 stop:552 length:228 start_codon:yes stop_codon:yes gene_type:complete
MRLAIELTDEEAEKLLYMLSKSDCGGAGAGYQSDLLELVEGKLQAAVQATKAKGSCICKGFFTVAGCPVHAYYKE